MKRAPHLKREHRDARILFATEMLEKTTNWWRSVVFSDEKSLNLTVQVDWRNTGPTSHSTRVIFPSAAKEEKVS